jgi:hypothetical protein
MADALKRLGSISTDPVTGKHDLVEMIVLFQDEAKVGHCFWLNLQITKGSTGRQAQQPSGRLAKSYICSRFAMPR